MAAERSAREPSPAELVISDLREQLRPYYVTDETIEQLEVAGFRLRGVRYLERLFSPEPEVTLEEQLTSAYVGATVYGDASARQRSYDTLQALPTAPDSNGLLVDEIDKALQQERRVINRVHLRRLESATRELAKPAPK